MRTYHAKGEVSWFKSVELAADQKLDPTAQNLENSKNQNLYKENQDPNFSEGRQNLTKVGRTLYLFSNVCYWQAFKVNNYREALIKQK